MEQHPLLLCRISRSICTKRNVETYLQSNVFGLNESSAASKFFDVRKRKARCKGNYYYETVNP